MLYHSTVKILQKSYGYLICNKNVTHNFRVLHSDLHHMYQRSIIEFVLISAKLFQHGWSTINTGRCFEQLFWWIRQSKVKRSLQSMYTKHYILLLCF